MTLREGDSVPGFPPGIVFDDLRFVVADGAMNDEGDVVTSTGVAGPGIEPDSNVLIVIRERRIGRWYPLMQSGTDIGGRIAMMESPNDAANAYWSQTGGSDGLRQSFNDDRRLTLTLEFDDQTLGAYILELPALGDFDGDGVLDLLDYEAFLGCVTGAAATELPPSCDTFDIDWDGDVDSADFGLFQILIGAEQ